MFQYTTTKLTNNFYILAKYEKKYTTDQLNLYFAQGNCI